MLRHALLFIAFMLIYGCKSFTGRDVTEKEKAEYIPKDYHPTYMTTTVPVTELRDSLIRQETNHSGTGVSPLKLEIRNIITDNFPSNIEIRAVVYDTAGRYITGMAPPYYNGKGNYLQYWSRLRDSCAGGQGNIGSFDVQEIQDKTSEPHAISFILDHSPSMGHIRALKLQQAVKATLANIKAGDYVSIIKFSASLFYEVRLTNDKSFYTKGLKVDGLRGNYGMGTAVYDAALGGIQQLVGLPSKYRRIAVIFTDGEDNSSSVTIDSVLNAAREANVSLYTVAYGQADTENMVRLARETGGRFYQIYSTYEFELVFNDIYFSLNNYYRIKYRPPHCNDLHKVTLAVNLPEIKDIHPLIAETSYDRSIFSSSPSVGEVSFVNIEFEFGKSDILSESMQILNDVALTMKENPSLRVRITGHTDDVGSEEFNLKLSLDRASAVKKKLMEMGIDGNRLEIDGKGKSEPLYPNDTEENRHKNRRTEFVIIEK